MEIIRFVIDLINELLTMVFKSIVFVIAAFMILNIFIVVTVMMIIG